MLLNKFVPKDVLNLSGNAHRCVKCTFHISLIMKNFMILKAVNFSSARVNHDNLHVITTNFQGKVMYFYGKRIALLWVFWH
jgi:hypothetical protein